MKRLMWNGWKEFRCRASKCNSDRLRISRERLITITRITYYLVTIIVRSKNMQFRWYAHHAPCFIINYAFSMSIIRTEPAGIFWYSDRLRKVAALFEYICIHVSCRVGRARVPHTPSHRANVNRSFRERYAQRSR